MKTELTAIAAAIVLAIVAVHSALGMAHRADPSGAIAQFAGR